MNRVTAFFRPEYAPAAIPSLSRLALAAEVMHDAGLVELVAPQDLDRAALDGLHDPVYLEAFHRGTEPLGSSQGIAWSEAIRDATYAMLGGQLAAVDHALREGIALNLARGFHHAVRARGAGHCALNGLALVAHARPDLRVLVIDCDEHGGNGTEEFAAELGNLHSVSIFGTRFGCRGGTRSWAFHTPDAGTDFTIYRDALRATREIARDVQPGVILFQAGADCHENDPKSRARLTATQMFERDLAVFGLAADLDVPIVGLLGGGYQDPSAVAQLNANTARAAVEVTRRRMAR
jgi:acetoin utilization deacetylase AcuC-like enzyme